MNYVEMMKPVIEKAGKLVMSYFRSNLTVEYKKDQSFATNADFESEKLLKTELEALIPGSGFIAEESGINQGNEYTWVIDPVDGTKNFSRGIPYFCINVALMNDSELVAAVTYYPAMQEWFYAQKGFGAWRNGQRLELNQRPWEQKGALVVISGFQVRQNDLLANISNQFKQTAHGVRFRLYGAAALDLAYAAAGTFDAVLFENLGWWDAAAGVLLVKEAGGYVSQYDGSEVDSNFKTVIAGHLEICQMLLPLLKT